MKQAHCIICNLKFTPVRFMQRTCDYHCALKYAKQKQDEAKTRNEGKRPVINSKPLKSQSDTKSHADHLNELQIAFNRFIRERDKGEACISCNRDWQVSFQAGHFYSVGGNPALRFHESNCHGQCRACNVEKHGNLNEYAKMLPFRIGTEKTEELNRMRSIHVHLSTPHILELKKIYQDRINAMRTRPIRTKNE